MAYRRRKTTRRCTTFEDLRIFSTYEDGNAAKSIFADGGDSAPNSSSSSSSSPSVPSSSFPSPLASPAVQPYSDRRRSFHKQGSNVYEYSSNTQSPKCPRNGFWEVLAQKAKSILEDDSTSQQIENHDSNNSPILNSADDQAESKWSAERYWKADNPPVQNEAIASSLNEIRGTIKNALEEGISTIMESKTAIISETNKLEISRPFDNPDAANQANKPMDMFSPADFTRCQTEYEAQLKSSKKVANAMAAKAKLLLRELKTVKADLDFLKQRCTQLEEENKALRENRQKGNNPADDDLIRHQIETLLAEKGRLAHENSVYARENRFLREIVEYHQLTMQDVVYLDDGIEDDIEEVSEAYPIHQMATTSSPVRSVDEVTSPSRSSSDSVAPGLRALSMDSAAILEIPNVEKVSAEKMVSPLQSPKAS